MEISCFFQETYYTHPQRRECIYDASYVWLARKLDLPLITEDNKLRKAVKKDLKVLSTKDIK
ncbi:Hypothetical Protein SiL_0792 [Sulfolobus islandicus LAL14/1]|uniref:PIN domain-containing protein n=1 Tax=Saccharolobus islandicus LAL14/1 TaxID=1241935 RepID=M9U5G1_SACIS|nr:Hypothetical Protein SiL_0792 [Sulfolobus islandicus LAL14/1]